LSEQQAQLSQQDAELDQAWRALEERQHENSELESQIGRMHSELRTAEAQLTIGAVVAREVRQLLPQMAVEAEAEPRTLRTSGALCGEQEAFAQRSTREQVLDRHCSNLHQWMQQQRLQPKRSEEALAVPPVPTRGAKPALVGSQVLWRAPAAPCTAELEKAYGAIVRRALEQSGALDDARGWPGPRLQPPQM
jgi:hypothetical protein